VFTQTVVGPSGDAAVLAYNDDVEHLLDFTMDHDKIEKTIGSLQTGTSGARLYDALSTSVGLLRNRPPSRRRVIIVVGEARDSRSEQARSRLRRRARSDCPRFPAPRRRRRPSSNGPAASISWPWRSGPCGMPRPQ